MPLRLPDTRREPSLCMTWFNESRPHGDLGDATTREVYDGVPPANTRLRFEPRERWPVKSCWAPAPGEDSLDSRAQPERLVGNRHEGTAGMESLILDRYAALMDGLTPVVDRRRRGREDQGMKRPGDDVHP